MLRQACGFFLKQERWDNKKAGDFTFWGSSRIRVRNAGEPYETIFDSKGKLALGIGKRHIRDIGAWP